MSTVFLISYDLNASKDYDELHQAIKDYPGWSHILESSWFISASTSSALDIRDDLEEHVDADDELLVTQMPKSGGGRWATTFSGETVDWLKDNL
jgi:hypothetical protein